MSVFWFVFCILIVLCCIVDAVLGLSWCFLVIVSLFVLLHWFVVVLWCVVLLICVLCCDLINGT